MRKSFVSPMIPGKVLLIFFLSWSLAKTKTPSWRQPFVGWDPEIVQQPPLGLGEPKIWIWNQARTWIQTWESEYSKEVVWALLPNNIGFESDFRRKSNTKRTVSTNMFFGIRRTSNLLNFTTSATIKQFQANMPIGMAICHLFRIRLYRILQFNCKNRVCYKLLG